MANTARTKQEIGHILSQMVEMCGSLANGFDEKERVAGMLMGAIALCNATGETDLAASLAAMLSDLVRRESWAAFKGALPKHPLQ